MAIRQFIGGAADVRQLTPVVPGSTVLVGNVYKLTSPNGSSISYTATAPTVANVTAGLAAILNSSTLNLVPEFQSTEFAATDMGTYLQLLGVPGQPFTITPSATAGSGGGSPTLVIDFSISTPGAATLADVTTGGTLNFATPYYYRVSALSPFGETLAHAEQTITTANDSLTTHKVTIAIAVAGATAYRLYGRATGAELFIQQMNAWVPGASVTLVDDGTITPSGALPAGNTTAGAIAASGSEFWSTAANWSGNVIPANNDTVDLTGYAGDILYGLNTGLTGITIIAPASFTGGVGLSLNNTTNRNFPYQEYRVTDLQIQAASCTIGQGAGTGCTRFKMKQNSAGSCSFVIYGTGTSRDTNLPTVLLDGSNFGNVITISKGTLGLGALPNQDFQCTTLTVGNQGSTPTDAYILVRNATISVGVTMFGGTLDNYSSVAVPGLQVYQPAVVTFWGASSVTNNVLLTAGTLWWNSSGSIGGTLALATANGQSGAIDFSENQVGIRSFTAGATVFYAGAVYNDPNGITGSGASTFTYNCDMEDVTVNFGYGRVWTLTT